MEYTLMHKDLEVLRFDLDDCYIQVLNNDFLPYQLKDCIQTTSTNDMKKAMSDIFLLHDYFIGRTLNFSRENAKAILNSGSFSQSLSPSEKMKIVFACKGLTMTDCFWLKQQGETCQWKDVDLRMNRLSDVSYEIAILGKNISATAEELRPDLSTVGMYPKYWKREPDGIYMWKTDKTSNFINTISELQVSDILDTTTVPHVKYMERKKDDKVFAISKCIATDDVSYIPAQQIIDWCNHTDQNLNDVISDFKTNFANMCICDYVLANGDRHNENWGVLVSNETNEILTFAPIMDHNQALVADYMQTDVDAMMHTASDLCFADMAEKYAPLSNVMFDEKVLPEKCLERYKKVQEIREKTLDNRIAFAEARRKKPEKTYSCREKDDCR